MIVHRLISFILLILLSPLLLIISIMILLDDGFPIIFKQKRIGINNSTFLLLKFRTMKNGSPNLATHLLKGKKNLYTSCGLFLRKYSIDELPQLINIIRGEMAIVGPRPALHNQDDLIKMRTHFRIHSLIPGITGYAQVNGRDELSIKDKVALDHYYLLNKSFTLEIKIIYLTLLKVIKAEDVSV